MPTPLLALRDSSFPMADCASCGKAVLTYVALDDDGAERRVCVHCDTPIAENLKWVSPGELEQAGYYFGPPPAEGEEGGCSPRCGSCRLKKHCARRSAAAPHTPATQPRWTDSSRRRLPRRTA